MAKGVYLHLFHGRKTVDEQLEDWGEDGPVIGPLDFAHTTYASDIKIREEESGENGWLDIIEGMVYYNGMFYGDWSVFSHSMLLEDKMTPVKFEQEKAEIKK